MKQQTLSIDLLKFDGGTQSRISINDEVVGEYAELIAEATDWPFPPLDVFHDGTDYWPADGFHRGLGALRAKRASVPCNIHTGTATDARIFGMTANDRHGLRMTRADKRACVDYLLDNPPKRTQAEIAQLAGVTARTVRQIVADRGAAALKMPPQRPEKRKTSAFVAESGESVVDTLSPPPETEPETVEPDLSTPDTWTDTKPAAAGKPKPPVKALEGREAEAFDARQSVGGMMKTIDQWMRNVNWTVDRIRNEFPSKTGDEVLKHLSATYAAMKTWEKGIK